MIILFSWPNEPAQSYLDNYSNQHSQHSPCDIPQTARASRVLDLTGTPPGFYFLGNRSLDCGTTGRLDLRSDARHGVIKTVTDRAVVMFFFEIDRNSQL